MGKFMTAVVSVALVACSSAALANQYQDRAVAPQVTVQQTLQMPDDQQVRLSGTIVQKIGYQHYQLRDKTGKVTIEIDDDLNVPQDLMGKTVTVVGEVDRQDHTQAVEIEVDTIHF